MKCKAKWMRFWWRSMQRREHCTLLLVARIEKFLSNFLCTNAICTHIAFQAACSCAFPGFCHVFAMWRHVDNASQHSHGILFIAHFAVQLAFLLLQGKRPKQSSVTTDRPKHSGISFLAFFLHVHPFCWCQAKKKWMTLQSCVSPARHC